MEKRNQLKIGDPTDPKSFTSAVIDDKAFARIKGYIDHAKSSPNTEIIGEENVIIGNIFDFILKSPHSHFNFYSVLVTSLNLQSYCRRIPKIN